MLKIERDISEVMPQVVVEITKSSFKPNPYETYFQFIHDMSEPCLLYTSEQNLVRVYGFDQIVGYL